MTAPGSMSAHDDLCEAYMAWLRTPLPAPGPVRDNILGLATACGMPAGEPRPFTWIKRRVETYRQEIAA